MGNKQSEGFQNDLVLKEKIETGTFATVYKILDRREGNQVKAMKKIHQSFLDLKHDYNELLSSLTHLNIARYYFFFKSGHYYFIITEYCQGADLAKRLMELYAQYLQPSEKQIMEWIIQIVIAIEYMHSCNILHSDLKPSNIYLNEYNIIKVGDYALPIKYDVISAMPSKGNTAAPRITLNYMSPEVLQGQLYDSKSEIWSIGCILYEMCTYRRAFEGNTSIEILDMIKNPNALQLPQSYSNNIKHLISITLAFSPDERPSASQLLDSISKPVKNLVLKHYTNHPYYKHIKFLCHFKINNHIVMSDWKQRCLHILDALTYEYINQLNYNGQMGKMTGVCENDQDNFICAVDNTHSTLLLFNKDYKIVKILELEKKLVDMNGTYGAIDFNSFNSIYYLISSGHKESILMIDKDLNAVLREIQLTETRILNSIKVINNIIYVCDNHNDGEKSRILAFDANLNYLLSFGENKLNIPQDIFINPKNLNHIYITDKFSFSIAVFDIRNLKYVGNVKANFVGVDFCAKFINDCIVIPMYGNRGFQINVYEAII